MSQKTTDLKMQSKKMGPLGWAFSARKKRSVRRSLWRWFWLRVVVLAGLIVLIRLRQQQAAEQEEEMDYLTPRREPAFQPPATLEQSPPPAPTRTFGAEAAVGTGTAISYRAPETREAAAQGGAEAQPTQAAEAGTSGDWQPALPGEDIQQDNLQAIEGIGPRIASVFQEAGIRTYRQLAETDPSRMEEILRSAGINLADTSTWAEQARLAAAGDWGRLREMQDQLKGGRKTES